MSTNDANVIKDQVRLPLSVGFGVVLQGIRIRLGRSVVTVLGVVLGVAFLTAILTAQIIKTDVAKEEAARVETARMMSVLADVTGPLKDAPIAVINNGALSDLEQRLFQSIAREGIQEARIPQGGVAGSEWGERAKPVAPAEFIAGAHVVLAAGSAPLKDSDFDAIKAANAARIVVVTTRKDRAAELPAGAVLLQRELNADEIKLAAAEERRNLYKTVWITAIALLVTVFGICNSMLMSVTERFREIGTMRCLGALSSFIRRLFLIEACLMGVVGSLAGAAAGAAFAIVAYSFTYGFGLVVTSLDLTALLKYMAASIVSGMVVAVVAAIYPAQFASRMVPATALRSNI